MCGVLGIINQEEDVASRLVEGAQRLQNRGIQSTKIFVYDDCTGFFHQHGSRGPASIVFRNFDLKDLPGRMGCAHTRYVTAGGDSPEKILRNIQPVYNDKPGMATCANGDLVNLSSQREWLKKERGYSFDTESDAKVIQNTLRAAFNKRSLYACQDTNQYAAVMFDAVGELNSQLIGAYSVVTVLERGILAFKDPRGIRPLCMARREKDGKVAGYIFSSESSVLNLFGDYSGMRELKPGEAVFVDKDTLQVYSVHVKRGREAFCFFEYTYFAKPDSIFLGRCVEEARERLGAILAEEYSTLKDRIDYVVGIPATGVSAALRFGECINRPVKNAIIKSADMRSFQETSQEKRQKAIEEKFVFVKELIEGRKIAVIDDSNVRGNTAKKMVKKLFSLGAKEVHYLFFTPRIIGPCFYGIDTPDENELIASGRTNKEIQDFIGATSVNYISLNGLINGLAVPEEKLCLACLTKNYPTPVEEAEERVRIRKEERICSSNCQN